MLSDGKPCKMDDRSVDGATIMWKVITLGGDLVVGLLHGHGNNHVRYHDHLSSSPC